MRIQIDEIVGAAAGDDAAARLHAHARLKEQRQGGQRNDAAGAVVQIADADLGPAAGGVLDADAELVDQRVARFEVRAAPVLVVQVIAQVIAVLLAAQQDHVAVVAVQGRELRDPWLAIDKRSLESIFMRVGCAGVVQRMVPEAACDVLSMPADGVSEHIGAAPQVLDVGGRGPVDVLARRTRGPAQVDRVRPELHVLPVSDVRGGPADVVQERIGAPRHGRVGAMIGIDVIAVGQRDVRIQGTNRQGNVDGYGPAGVADVDRLMDEVEQLFHPAAAGIGHHRGDRRCEGQRETLPHQHRAHALDAESRLLRRERLHRIIAVVIVQQLAEGHDAAVAQGQQRDLARGGMPHVVRIQVPPGVDRVLNHRPRRQHDRYRRARGRIARYAAQEPAGPEGEFLMALRELGPDGHARPERIQELRARRQRYPALERETVGRQRFELDLPVIGHQRVAVIVPFDERRGRDDRLAGGRIRAVGADVRVEPPRYVFPRRRDVRVVLEKQLMQGHLGRIIAERQPLPVGEDQVRIAVVERDALDRPQLPLPVRPLVEGPLRQGPDGFQRPGQILQGRLLRVVDLGRRQLLREQRRRQQALAARRQRRAVRHRRRDRRAAAARVVGHPDDEFDVLVRQLEQPDVFDAGDGVVRVVDAQVPLQQLDL